MQYIYICLSMYTQYKVTNEQFIGMAAELHFWDLLHEQAQLESNWKA